MTTTASGDPEPITHAIDERIAPSTSVCRCTSCGYTATPRPMFDFLVVGDPPHTGKPLLCQRCWYVAVTSAGLPDPPPPITDGELRELRSRARDAGDHQTARAANGALGLVTGDKTKAEHRDHCARVLDGLRKLGAEHEPPAEWEARVLASVAGLRRRS